MRTMIPMLALLAVPGVAKAEGALTCSSLIVQV